MKILIFAGGTGRRLWPLSRKDSPKQFQIFKEGKSTLQRAVDRVREFGLENVYIATNKKYKQEVQDQIPNIEASHILTEPAKKDLGAAVGLSLLRLKKQGVDGPIAMLWADHLMSKPDNFRSALRQGKKLVKENPEQFVFLAEEARFANENMGWIHLGENITDNQYKFKGWKYRPQPEQCKEMYESGDWAWNPGYFIFDIDFCLNLYQQHESEMYNKLQDMVADEQKLEQEYGQLEEKHFDDAIAAQLDNDQATVLKVDLGWSDPGTLYALKEALTEDQLENLIKGEGDIFAKDTEDSLIYSEQENKLTVALGLNGKIVINTEDVLLVCSKESVNQLKTLLKELEQEGFSEYL